VRLGVTPEINAVCTLFIVAVTAIVLAASLVTKRETLAREAAARAM
jgi:putrescine transport system permease protein